MSEHKVDGGTMLLFIDPIGGTNYNTVVCLASVGNSMSVQPVDASSACGPDKSPGAIDISYTFEGQHLQDPISGNISGTDLRLLLMAEQTVGWKLSPETPVAGDEIQEGTGYLSELSSTYAFDSVGVFSGTLQPYGVPTITINNIPYPIAFTFKADNTLGNASLNGLVNAASQYISSTIFDAYVDWGDGSIIEYYTSNTDQFFQHYFLSNNIFDVKVYFANPENIILCENNFDKGAFYMTELDHSLLINITTIEIYVNQLSSTQINKVLNDLVNNGLNGGFLNTVNQTPPAPPTGQGIIDKATLISRGWTVGTD
jgi:hypothetical protein